jgi:hypothetical protein
MKINLQRQFLGKKRNSSSFANDDDVDDDEYIYSKERR